MYTSYTYDADTKIVIINYGGNQLKLENIEFEMATIIVTFLEQSIENTRLRLINSISEYVSGYGR